VQCRHGGFYPQFFYQRKAVVHGSFVNDNALLDTVIGISGTIDVVGIHDSMCMCQ